MSANRLAYWHHAGSVCCASRDLSDADVEALKGLYLDEILAAYRAHAAKALGRAHALHAQLLAAEHQADLWKHKARTRSW